ncbi:MAG: phosphatase PAP2 family protein [Myxococcales bacterium]|nr:phosphatase PAP2 family protein [Myxococcales bacterium]
MRRLCLALAVATASLVVAPPPAVAQPDAGAPHVLFAPQADVPPKLAWRFRPVQTWELYATGGFALAAVGAYAAGASADRWHGGVVFDDDVRRSVRPGSYQRRRSARDASDLTLALGVAQPMLGDGLLTSYWYHRSPEVAEQLLLINAETLAITVAVQTSVSSLASRERPYGRDCGTELDPELNECSKKDRYRSFFSGHAATAFSAASVSCLHHTYLPLYGGGAAEVASCAAGYALAGATSALRVVGDMHYASDVAVGAAWGTLAGLGVPWLLHYRHPVGERSRAARVHLVPHPTGLAIGGAF